jgi:quercetin dioxygenase-like cupin family protein
MGDKMRFIQIMLIAVAGAVVGAAASTIAQTTPIKSKVFDWTKLEVQTNAAGEKRAVMKEPTPTLDELEIHITTLKPGESPHPPHRHPEEELMIVREGTIETTQNGRVTRVGPGSVIFQASNELHGLKNVGTTPATYHVIQFRVPHPAN